MQERELHVHCNDRPPGRSATVPGTNSPKPNVKTHPYIFPHVIARSKATWQSVFPLLRCAFGGSTGERIATGLATLAMTCGKFNPLRIRPNPVWKHTMYRADHPGGRSLRLHPRLLLEEKLSSGARLMRCAAPSLFQTNLMRNRTWLHLIRPR